VKAPLNGEAYLVHDASGRILDVSTDVGKTRALTTAMGLDPTIFILHRKNDGDDIYAIKSTDPALPVTVNDFPVGPIEHVGENIAIELTHGAIVGIGGAEYRFVRRKKATETLPQEVTSSSPDAQSPIV